MNVESSRPQAPEQRTSEKRPAARALARLRRPTLALALCAEVAVVSLAACAARRPANLDNSCAMFDEKRSWYDATRRSQKRWGVPIHVQLAIMHQESSFKSQAKPPRKKFLWIFPGRRPSSASGYTQALDETWEQYVRESGNRGANRDDFRDSADFIGWYGDGASRRAGVPRTDAYRMYLAYHEGPGGYMRGTYKNKPWLIRVAGKVRNRSNLYQSQLVTCEDRLRPRWWQFWRSS